MSETTETPDENRYGMLLERARTTDANAALLELVTMFSPMVKAVVRRRCRPADVDDVVQDVWLALWENVDRIRSPACLPGWLKRVAVNAAIASDRKNRALLVSDLPEPRRTSDQDDPTVRPVLVAATRQVVRKALDGLKEPQRQVLELLMSDERPSYAQVSQHTSRRTGGIGPTRQRALNQLRTTSTICRLASGE